MKNCTVCNREIKRGRGVLCEKCIAKLEEKDKELLERLDGVDKEIMESIIGINKKYYRGNIE